MYSFAYISVCYAHNLSFLSHTERIGASMLTLILISTCPKMPHQQDQGMSLGHVGHEGHALKTSCRKVRAWGKASIRCPLMPQ